MAQTNKSTLGMNTKSRNAFEKSSSWSKTVKRVTYLGGIETAANQAIN